ncbi:hypothetical protein IDA31_001379 [Salmonella enterica]|nr:hypothetical protein [Salmonella enterica]HCS4438936.1 hypothetical protein [Salmonella enterica subsp. enterica serovar Newport]
MDNFEKNKGMPIFLDEIRRNISDSFDLIDVDAWFPSNNAAQKLWRCLESLKDLNELVFDAEQQKNATKKKRKLKIALTHLHTLVMSLDDLCNEIHSNKDTRSLLDEKSVAEVLEIQKLFSSLLPHDHKADISTARNKVSAHIDKKMNPFKAQAIIGLIPSNEFGRCLHICLHLVLDLTKLNIYHWSCKAPSHDYVRFMTNEPFILTVKVDGEKMLELAALHIANNSPKNDIPEIVQNLVTHSQWMFKKGQPRISSLKEENKDNWNTFKTYSHFHKSNTLK